MLLSEVPEFVAHGGSLGTMWFAAKHSRASLRKCFIREGLFGAGGLVYLVNGFGW